MKYLPVLFLIVFATGCSLSKGAHLKVVGQSGERTDSSCGYFSNALRFGDENEISFSHNKIDVTVCSREFHSVVVARGFIIPLYPVINGHEISREYKWVKVSNSGGTAFTVSNSNTLIKASLKRYPDYREEELLALNEAGRNVPGGSHVWVGFPKNVPLTLGIKAPESDIALVFEKAKSYSWYMITR